MIVRVYGIGTEIHSENSFEYIYQMYIRASQLHIMSCSHWIWYKKLVNLVWKKENITSRTLKSIFCFYVMGKITKYYSIWQPFRKGHLGNMSEQMKTFSLCQKGCILNLIIRFTPKILCHIFFISAFAKLSPDFLNLLRISFLQRAVLPRLLDCRSIGAFVDKPLCKYCALPFFDTKAGEETT